MILNELKSNQMNENELKSNENEWKSNENQIKWMKMN